MIQIKSGDFKFYRKISRVSQLIPKRSHAVPVLIDRHSDVRRAVPVQADNLLQV